MALRKRAHIVFDIARRERRRKRLRLQRRRAHALTIGWIETAQRISDGYEAPRQCVTHALVVPQAIGRIDQARNRGEELGPGERFVKSRVRKFFRERHEAFAIARRVIPRAPSKGTDMPRPVLIRFDGHDHTAPSTDARQIAYDDPFPLPGCISGESEHRACIAEVNLHLFDLGHGKAECPEPAHRALAPPRSIDDEVGVERAPGSVRLDHEPSNRIAGGIVLQTTHRNATAKLQVGGRGKHFAAQAVLQEPATLAMGAHLGFELPRHAKLRGAVKVLARVQRH